MPEHQLRREQEHLGPRERLSSLPQVVCSWLWPSAVLSYVSAPAGNTGKAESLLLQETCPIPNPLCC